MSVADRIGLLPGFGWIAGHPFWMTLLICWAITPGMMIVIAPVLEGRWLPLSPREQFISFFPGDLFLGSGVAALLTAARELPDERRWYSAPAIHIVAICLAAAVAYWLTFKVELEGGVYPKRAITSPTKLYHNGVLYIAYGYVASVALIAVVGGLGWREVFEGGWLTLAIIFLAIWALSVIFEGVVFGKDGMALKARYAHVADWRPFWVPKTS